jgi:copper chaperone CopZ
MQRLLAVLLILCDLFPKFSGLKRITIYIKNMVCQCCLRVIREDLERAGIVVDDISLGRATISFEEDKIGLNDVREVLVNLGTDLVESRDSQLVEEIKLAVIELVHHMNNVDSMVRKSEYLVEKTGLSDFPILTCQESSQTVSRSPWKNISF